MSGSITSFFSSFISTVHADSEQAQSEETSQPQHNEAEPEAEPEKAAEEEEEEEPEDLHPTIRDECKEKRCTSLAKHFDHCQEKVHAGEGFKGEDCVEELMMHCIDDCAAPKLFEKLK